MAKKSAKKNIPVEEKLKNLYELQLIDSEINEIERLKGELPMEVKELEDEIVGLETRTEKLENDLKEVEMKVTKYNNSIKEAETLIEKYEHQQKNVKNNREYDALTREIELQKLDIQLANKRIREAKQQLSNKEITLEAAVKKRDLKKEDLERKKEELEKIIKKTEKKEKTLERKLNRARKKIEDRLLKAYDRVRGAYKNRLAVVTIERDACGGCHNYVPPQTRLEVNQRKRIVICQHCGRIIVDDTILEEEPEEEEAEG